MPASADPVQLMIRAKAGDDEAFSQLHQTYFVPVFRYVLRRIDNRDDAEDIAQTVFVKLYTSKAVFTNQHRDPLAYLFTMARNALIDHWRKERKQERIEAEEKADILETIAQTQEIQKALAHLNAEHRQILELRFFQGYKADEIAEKLGKTPANIRQIQCRALQKLRTYLGSYDS